MLPKLTAKAEKLSEALSQVLADHDAEYPETVAAIAILLCSVARGADTMKATVSGEELIDLIAQSGKDIYSGMERDNV